MRPAGDEIPDDCSIRVKDLRERLGLTQTRWAFAFETTLSGLGYTRWIPVWREGGNRVKLLFLRLPMPGMAVARVRQRVSEAGHDVPEAIVRRRYRAGWRNFERVYRDLVDEWAIYDNSGIPPVLLAEGGNR